MEKVGDYEYDAKDLIGHGAFAIVFKGRHQKNHDFVVAIKCMSKQKINKTQPLIEKEIKILRELTKLHHKNVVDLYECVDSPKNLYIVMEYCNGGDLSEYLNAKGSLSEDTIRIFLRQIAEAMKVLKLKEVVHRDLKPQNILLCHSGKPNPAPSEITLTIADFGFACFLTDGLMTATVCGSPVYMAPEVLMSLKYDAKADLWSIGTIVYQCLTGKAPFMAPNPLRLKHFYENNANLAPSIPNGTSQELTDLLLRLMKRDAKDRMDFCELFDHPFLKTVPRSCSPFPVQTEQSITPINPLPPHVSSFPAVQSNSWDACSEEMIQSLPSPLNNSCLINSDPGDSSLEHDFVFVFPNLSEKTKFSKKNKNSPLKHQLIPDHNIEQESFGATCQSLLVGGMCLDSSPTSHFVTRGTSPTISEGHFVSPKLQDETLLEKEHNETLAKLNFISALVNAILELAKTRSSPLSSVLTGSKSRTNSIEQAMGDSYRRVEQLLLYMKVLQLISSAFQLSQHQVRNGHLQPSPSVRNVLQHMKEHYHYSLSMSKSLNSPGLLQSVGVDPSTLDVITGKILYKYAIEMCQCAALEELFGDPKESFCRYSTAQVLLHSLGQQVRGIRDKELLYKYRDTVQRRLEILTNHQSVICLPYKRYKDLFLTVQMKDMLEN